MSSRSFLDPKIIARLSHHTLESRRAMIGSVSGRHRSPLRGSSLEFAQYRSYVPGDDTRRLDWRVWGRSDRSYIKEFEADTNLRMCLVLDTSGSMNYGPNGVLESPNTKLRLAQSILGTLAWLAAKQGDAVGLYSAGETLTQEIPPRRGGRHLKAILDQIGACTANGETGLVDTLHLVAEKVARRGLVVIVSDLFLEPKDLLACFQHLRHRKHDVVVFHLVDQNELDFQFDQPMKFLDLEGGMPILADPHLIADSYRQTVRNYLEELHEVIRTTEVDYRRFDLEQDIGEALARFLNSRVMRRGRR